MVEPLGPSAFVRIHDHCVPESVYWYSTSGVWLVALLFFQTFVRRPMLSYCAVVTLLFESVTVSGLPRPKSTAVVVVNPAPLPDGGGPVIVTERVGPVAGV